MDSKSGKIKELYNTCCEDYDKHMIKTGHYAAQEKIIDLINDQIAEPVLDLACGTGFLIRLLLKKFPSVVGNDFSEEMVKIARKNTNVKITNEDAEELNSYNNKFKTIISCNLFFYLQNKSKAINKWKNLLDTDGKIIFIEEHPFMQPSSKEMDSHITTLMSLVDPLSIQDIQNIMKQNGFKLIKDVQISIDDKHNLYGLVFSLK